MNSIQIGELESDVPLPSGGASNRVFAAMPFDTMEVGQSFKVDVVFEYPGHLDEENEADAREIDALRAAALEDTRIKVRNAANGYRNRNDLREQKHLCVVQNGEVRCWRTK